MSSHSFDYEYEQDGVEEIVAVEVELDLKWYGAEHDVGIMSNYCEINDIDISVNGVDVVWRKELNDTPSQGWDLSPFPIIKDVAAFVKDLDKRCDNSTEYAEPDEPDYEY